MPKEALTKAEAAVLIYNCLKADFDLGINNKT